VCVVDVEEMRCSISHMPRKLYYSDSMLALMVCQVNGLANGPVGDACSRLGMTSCNG
jgi:hypothetical protein